MQRRPQQPLNPDQKQLQDELQQVQAINSRINKLQRKFQAELDPVQDRLDAIAELKLLVQTYLNNIVTERDTLRIELRTEREISKSLKDELDELKKQLDPNVEATPEPTKKKVTPKPEPEKPTKPEPTKKKPS